MVELSIYPGSLLSKFHIKAGEVFFLLHTFFEVPQSSLTVTLIMATMETLETYAMKAQVTGQVISPEMAEKRPNHAYT